MARNMYEYFTMRNDEYVVDLTILFAESKEEAVEFALDQEAMNLQMDDVLVICKDVEPKGRWAYQIGEGTTLIGGWGFDYPNEDDLF